MSRTAIQYEFDSTPEQGQTRPIAEGLHWLRMPLPFSLDHINLWLAEDGDSWIVVDSGVGTETSKGVWRQVFDGTMGGRPASHIVVTHLHPDHVGCAGWLADHFDADLWMSRDEYLLCRVLAADTGRDAPEEGVEFYKAAGFPDEALKHYREIFGFFGRFVTALPEAYHRLYDGLRAPLGDHEWEVVVGRGHSPEHACFFSESQNLFIAGDQVLPTISANVSVYPTEPDANPLKDWIDSLRNMRDRLPSDVLVLPAHGRPFRGAHERLDALVEEHIVKLDALHDYLDEPCRAVDVFPALYRAEISGDNLIMATGEAIAHLHYLLADDAITAEPDDNGVVWYRRA
jgi:glyoxylase-like metal-dependent hydrolase (beta-lactamase superfamily II)